MRRFYQKKIAMKTYVFISIMVFLCGCISTFNSSSGWYSKDNSLVKDILEPINEARAKGMMCGNRYYKPARLVVWNNTLGQAALHHSLDMAEKVFSVTWVLTGAIQGKDFQKLVTSGFPMERI